MRSACRTPIRGRVLHKIPRTDAARQLARLNCSYMVPEPSEGTAVTTNPVYSKLFT